MSSSRSVARGLHRRPVAAAPGGFSLLEAFVALAVFGGGLAAVAHALSAAQRASGIAHFRTAALIRAKSLHALVEAGDLDATRGAWRRCEDDATYLWRVEESVTQIPGMVRRTVTVVRQTGAWPQSFALTRVAPAMTDVKPSKIRPGRARVAGEARAPADSDQGAG